MTMHRHPLGQGRLLAAAAAVVILVASFLAWYTAGGDTGGLNPIACNAFDGRCGTAGGMKRTAHARFIPPARLLG